jgi:hypothetical protein
MNDALQSAQAASEHKKKHGLLRGINERLLKFRAKSDLGSPAVIHVSHKDKMGMIEVQRHFAFLIFICGLKYLLIKII